MDKLIRKASKGHQQSQLTLYEHFYGYCLGVALRFCESKEEAKEVVHDSFIKVFAKLGKGRNGNAFKSWIRRIVVNSAIDRFRSQMPNDNHMDVAAYDATDLSEDVLSRLSTEDLSRIIRQLPATYRMVFTLYAIEGYKHEEIAQKLRMSVGTCKTNLLKARAKLQKQILEMTPGFAEHG